ncbi:MAG: UDP-N-acetylmuramate dehydrogenase [Geobacteraceae bacterium]|nr:UDP-N-acetylmuramate dehydrogenase [Geobacteraceae bacterium]
MSSFDQTCAGFCGELLRHEPMSRHTSLKVGGPADLYAVPKDLEDLQLLVNWLDTNQVPRMVVGGGYNLLVRDGGIRGAVISLERLNSIEALDNGCIKAWSGAENLQVVRFGQQLGLGGIGFISGIPGTIGGAVRMNAGAYGNGLLDHADSLCLLRHGSVQEGHRSQIKYGYRRLELQPGDIILAATLQLEPTDPAVTEEEIRKDLELRRTKHNVGYPSAGSFFKNPPDQAAWRLIDAAGMRGQTVGGAQMAELHSNFLINRGSATATDCLELAQKVKQAVLGTSGIQLEEEVRIVGEEL